MKTTLLAATVSAIFLQGCDSYSHQVLPAGPDLASSADAARSRVSIQSIGALAERYNPDLIAARAQLPEASAREAALSALPDPAIGLSFDNPFSPALGVVSALSASIAYDLKSVVVEGATIDAQSMARLQVALNVDWQTWQTMQKARDLFIQLVFLNRKYAILENEVQVFGDDARRLKSAVATGDATVDVLGLSIVALSDAQTQLQTIRLQRQTTRDDLAALIGLRPEAQFALTSLPHLGRPRQSEVRSLLASLPMRRPDLLALQAGFESQNAAVRGAVLGQFPSISVGLSRAQDVAGVQSGNFSIALTLPLLDGNRRAIAVERATRERLRAEYQARLDATASEILALSSGIQGIDAEVVRETATLHEIDAILQKGETAYRSGDFPAQSYTSLRTASFSRQLAIADLEQQLWQSVNGMASLLGGIPSVAAIPKAKTQQDTTALLAAQARGK